METMKTGWLAGSKEVSGGYVADALSEGNMDWDVELHPVSTRIRTEGRDIKRTVEDTFAVVRMTDYKPLAAVGNNFVPVQHREAFGVLDLLVSRGELEIQYVRSIRDGRKVALVTSVPEGLEIVGEPYDFHLLWMNGHDGKTPVKMLPIPTRIYCANALPGIFEKKNNAFNIKHTKMAPVRLLEAHQETVGTNMVDALALGGTAKELDTEASRSMRLAYRYANMLRTTGEDLASQKMNDREFDAFLKTLVPIEKDDPPRQVTMREDRRASLRLIWRQEENLNDIRGTRWAAFQTVAQEVDHFRNYRGGADSKLMSIIEGRNDKQKALALLS